MSANSYVESRLRTASQRSHFKPISQRLCLFHRRLRQQQVVRLDRVLGLREEAARRVVVGALAGIETAAIDGIELLFGAHEAVAHLRGGRRASGRAGWPQLWRRRGVAGSTAATAGGGVAGGGAAAADAGGDVLGGGVFSAGVIGRPARARRAPPRRPRAPDPSPRAAAARGSRAAPLPMSAQGSTHTRPRAGAAASMVTRVALLIPNP